MRRSFGMKHEHSHTKNHDVNSESAGERIAPMKKRFLKRLLGAGALAGVAYTLWRAYAAQRVEPGVEWQSQPFPYPPQPAVAPAPAAHEVVAAAAASADPWVAPEYGACPVTHPVKAKLASGIFHVPGGASYERTRADRCYASAEAAAADGLRPSKR